MDQITKINNILVKLDNNINTDKLLIELISIMKHLNLSRKEFDDIRVDNLFSILDDGMLSVSRNQLILELKTNIEKLICFLNILKGYVRDG